MRCQQTQSLVNSSVLSHYFSLTVLETSSRHLQMELVFLNLGSTMFQLNVNSPIISHPRYICQSMQQPDIQSNPSFKSF